ncbi:hypothetical protein HAX54_028089 [Datura stramonium]|uniref:Protein kinase domain-containing protein n=1 Tax=Datura stramonium TaxID=4076 RepID=A0ABS8V5R7_DATST|nr:hypothetical protein [Datura stramonium]
MPPAPTMTLKMSKKFLEVQKIPICAKLYTMAELQLATSNFSPVNLLGEGTLGSVYRADFPDGQILAVKNIKTVALSITEEEQFIEPPDSRIAIGVSRALNYLHTSSVPPITHSNLKAANIAAAKILSLVFVIVDSCLKTTGQQQC